MKQKTGDVVGRDSEGEGLQPFSPRHYCNGYAYLTRQVSQPLGRETMVQTLYTYDSKRISYAGSGLIVDIGATLR